MADTKAIWIKDPLGIMAEGATRGVVVRDGRIVELVAAGATPNTAGTIAFDAGQHVVLPGLINTHHHFYQTLTRAVPAAMDRELFPWLQTLYPVWARLTPDTLDLAVTVAMSELLLSGCTTTTDHHYVFPAGLEDAVRRTSQEQYPPDGGINNVESLAGREIANYFPNLNAGVDEFSPTVRLFINQDALEPLIRGRAEALGARLRYGTECTALEQDADGVTAVLRDLASGAESTVRARYVVAADGNRSPVRDRLGIGMSGHGQLSHSITIYFRALTDLGPLLKDRNQGVHYVTNPLLRGFFRLDRSGGTGFLVINTVGADVTQDSAVDVQSGLTKERALEYLRTAIGNQRDALDRLGQFRHADGGDRGVFGGQQLTELGKLRVQQPGGTAFTVPTDSQ